MNPNLLAVSTNRAMCDAFHLFEWSGDGLLSGACWEPRAGNHAVLGAYDGRSPLSIPSAKLTHYVIAALYLIGKVDTLCIGTLLAWASGLLAELRLGHQ
jgi:hypothetical protein